MGRVAHVSGIRRAAASAAPRDEREPPILQRSLVGAQRSVMRGLVQVEALAPSRRGARAGEPIRLSRESAPR